MRFLIVGYGRVGRAVAIRLRTHGYKVEAVDVKRINEEVLDELHLIDVSRDAHCVSKLASDFDCTIGCLPGDLGYKFMKACASRGVRLVDVSFTCEDPLTLNEEAIRAGSTIIPDCGIAPGLSNMIVGLSSRLMDHVHRAEIKVGGIPATPKPPFYHSPSWSVEDLLEEYVRPARCVEDGVEVIRDPLDHRWMVEVGGLKLEGFLSDGLRTLLKMSKRPDNLRELTLRWRGHLDLVRLLRDLGFLSDDVIEVEGIKATARSLTARILEKSLPNEADIIVMEVRVQGVKNGRTVVSNVEICGSAFDDGLSTMAKVTGVVCSEVALLLARGEIVNHGVVPPENISNLNVVVKRVLSELVKLGIQVKVEGLEGVI